jgi:hypothetical protein
MSGHVAEGWAAVNNWSATADPVEDPADAAAAASFVSSFAVIVDPPSAAAHLARARRIAGPLANPALDAHLAYTSGLVERYAGHYDVAADDYQQAMELAARTGNPLIEGIALLSLGVMAAMTNSDHANATLHSALTRLLASRNWALVWTTIEALALYWARTGRDEPAAVLLGHLEANDIRYANFVEQRTEAVGTLRARNDSEDHLARGASLGRDQLVTYALNQLADTEP